MHSSAVIAHELLASLRENASVDWVHRHSTPAWMRMKAKQILKQKSAAPDPRDVGMWGVLQQAEALLERWATQARRASLARRRLGVTG